MKLYLVTIVAPCLLSSALLAAACGGTARESSSDSAGASDLNEAQLAYISPPDVTSSNGGGSSGGGSTAGPAELDVTFETCTNDSRRNEMRDALDDILDNWTAFKNNLEDLGLTSEHECMHDRLTQNGNVHCEACDVAGHSTALGQTANICRSWATSVEDRYPSSTGSRKVCWASVIMHEFGHTCERFEGGAELIDNAARQTLNDIYGLSLDSDSECNQD